MCLRIPLDWLSVEDFTLNDWHDCLFNGNIGDEICEPKICACCSRTAAEKGVLHHH